MHKGILVDVLYTVHRRPYHIYEYIYIYILSGLLYIYIYYVGYEYISICVNTFIYGLWYGVWHIG